MAKILVVEDDLPLSTGLCFELDTSGYLTVAAYNCQKALKLIKIDHFDLAILDINLPDGDGFELCREIKKEQPQLPVLFLTAKDLEQDVLKGFDLGADDYVTKPYNPQELIARVRSQLRRYTSLGDINAEGRQGLLVNGRLSYDPAGRILRADGDEVKLTPTESKIVDLLFRHPGQIFPAEEIYRRVWGEEAWSSENTVMVHIRRIREKIELNPREPDYLKVVWGIGYKMEKK